MRYYKRIGRKKYPFNWKVAEKGKSFEAFPLNIEKNLIQLNKIVVFKSDSLNYFRFST